MEPERPDEPVGVEIAPGVRVPEAALRFSFAAASGPGGQNVNKRATKAILRLALSDIPVSERVRTRSQRRNKDACLERLRELLIRALVPPKPRIATRPGRGAVERRLREKRERSQRKNRRREDLDEN